MLIRVRKSDNGAGYQFCLWDSGSVQGNHNALLGIIFGACFERTPEGVLIMTADDKPVALLHCETMEREI